MRVTANSEWTKAATDIRDHVLGLMRATGKWVDAAGIRTLEWKRGDFTAMLWTPFNPFPNNSPVLKDYRQAVLYQHANKPMSNQLNIWKGKKVFFVEWDDGVPLHIVSFRRGDWEHEILAIDASVSTSSPEGVGPP
jgi:hypothetical protein